MAAWYDSRFTGLVTQFRPVPLRPYDPPVPMYGATLAPWGPRTQELPVGGAGWDLAGAEASCVGEAIERCQPYGLPAHRAIECSYRNWPLDEAAITPARWVLFHKDQYNLPGFPFPPFTEETVCNWLCCREARTGTPVWVPEELIYIVPRSGRDHRLGPGLSTGLSCGRMGDPVLLRGLQEVIERDAIIGAWWGSYPLEEWEANQVFSLLEPSLSEKLLRPNLRYRFYRVQAEYSGHVTIVTVEGDDREGWLFSVGSACRETRRQSWLKSILEAVQGRHYVRILKPRYVERGLEVPTDFAEHAVYYSLHPELLRKTVFAHAKPQAECNGSFESLDILIDRLGPSRPVLFRNVTPPGIAQEIRDWYVLRVLVPGLQPMHGDHRLPQLGGPLWAPRGWTDYASLLPHPYP